MNVLLIIPEEKGTIARVSYNLYKGLKNRDDIALTVVSLDGSGVPEFDFGNPIRIKRTWFAPFYRIWCLRRIKKKNDIELSISTLSGANFYNICSRRNDKTVGIFHAPLDQTKVLGLFVYCMLYIIYRYLFCHFDRLVAVSSEVKNDLSKYVNKKVEVIYNIHDFERIIAMSQEKIEDSTELQLFSKPVILYVGALYDTKGTDRLLKAFEKIHLQNPVVKLVIMGRPISGAAEKIDLLVKSLKCKNQIYFIGYRENPYKYMKRSRMLVLPSRSEGLPGVIIESLALGTKVVSTNSSLGVWEIMESEAFYEKHLLHNVMTSFGIITPNLLDDEEFTINSLVQGVITCLSIDFPLLNLFDKSRFEEDTVVNKLLNNS